MLYFAYHRTSTEEQHLDRGLNEINKYNYVVVNDDLDKAVSEINEIIDNELQKRSK